MLTNPKLAFVITIVFLALCSCGSLESAKKDPKKTVSGVNAGAAQVNQLVAACDQANGRMTSDLTTCMTRVIKELKPAETNPDLVIDPAFYTGKFIVATATSGNVDMTYDGRLIGRIPARMQGDLGLQTPGKPLKFFPNSGVYKDVFVTIWTCYAGSMTNRVVCPPSQIP